MEKLTSKRTVEFVGTMILAIDGTSLCHVFWHATKDKPNGDPLEGFLGRVHRLKERFTRRDQPLTVIVAFDQDGPIYRSMLVAGYKAGRERDQELKQFIENSKEAISYSQSVRGVIAPLGYEADDVLATIAATSNGQVIIHSADKDLNQCLVSGRVTIIKRSAVNMQTNQLEVEWLATKHFVDEYGFEPSRWIDYQCLVGDATDNVAGAYGIGPKTAKEIIGQYSGRLEEANQYRLPLNSNQRSHWRDFVERLPALREVFRLQTRLKMPELASELVGEY